MVEINNHLVQVIKICERCQAHCAEKRRQHTFYPDEEDNYVTLCPPCHENNDSYWEEMWLEYYASQGYYKKGL